MIDIDKIRKDFPILQKQIHGKPLVYLDNAATTQKPKSVIDSIVEYYSEYNSNIHRGVHYLSQKATEKYEETRDIVQQFINAKSRDEIVFVRGATEAINLIAATYGVENINRNDEILISHMEHHSNIVPWQLLCERTGAKLTVAPIDDDGSIIWEDFIRLLSARTKLVSIAHISNSLGTINPVDDIIAEAHKRNIPVLVDAAQSIQHLKLDVQQMDCDFLVASGHKMYAPTGTGFLYAKKEILEKMPPYQGGGDMILSVSFDDTVYNVLPYRFEAGTQNISGVIGLGEAIKYIESIGLENIQLYENELLEYAASLLSQINELRIIGTSPHKSSIISFILQGIHPHDIGTFLDADGIAVRTGHHCTEPIMQRYGIPATTRASLAFYNTKEEIEILANSIKKIIKMFA